MKMTVTLLTGEGTSALVGGEELLAQHGPKWIDVEGADEPTMKALAERFRLHRLAVEDSLHLDQRPKLEEYPHHLFLVLQSFARPLDGSGEPTLHEMHFCVGSDWLITIHELPCQSVEGARRRIVADPSGTIGRGPDFVMYLVADELMDANFPVLDRFNDDLEELEARIFEHPSREQLERIFALKGTIVHLRRVLAPQRDVLALLTRPGLPHVQERTTLYFRDVHDHLLRLLAQVDVGREVVGNVREGYLSMVANRTNEITKQLTLFATLFLPLSFVVGFFGQNFAVLSEPPLLWVMATSIVGIPLGVFLWFRYRRWI